MKRNELRTGDIIVVDHSDSLRRRPTVHYVVMGDVAVAFKGDCNGGDRPMGWYDHMDAPEDLPDGTVAVYRPTHVTYTFHGDFDNPETYKCLWRA